MACLCLVCTVGATFWGASIRLMDIRPFAYPSMCIAQSIWTSPSPIDTTVYPMRLVKWSLPVLVTASLLPFNLHAPRPTATGINAPKDPSFPSTSPRSSSTKAFYLIVPLYLIVQASLTLESQPKQTTPKQTRTKCPNHIRPFTDAHIPLPTSSPLLLSRTLPSSPSTMAP